MKFEQRLFNSVYYSSLQSNCAISPLSLKMTFANLLNGTKGQTKEEILKAFDIDLNPEFLDLNRQICQKLQQNNYSEVSLANSLWLNPYYKYSAEFVHNSQRYFNSELFPLTTAFPINSWVSNKTKGRINNLIDDQLITPMTILILINALYFRSVWAEKFENTKVDKFQLYGKPFDKIFITLNKDLPYYEDSDIQLVRLFYKDYRYSCFILLPQNDEYSKNLSNVDFNSYQSKLKPHNVYLELPKFKIDFSLDLTNIVKLLGVTKAFQIDNKDFNGIFTNLLEEATVYISNVIQKVYIDLDEKGTEAAAATAIHMMVSGCMLNYIPQPSVSMIVNKPFFWWINDSTTNQNLFMGYVANPKQD